MAWHLPDNFNQLPLAKREEILEWVRTIIVSGSTEYRRYQAAAVRQRFAVRFQDTADTVAKHYGRFLPKDKAALAAKILNKAWEDA